MISYPLELKELDFPQESESKSDDDETRRLFDEFTAYMKKTMKEAAHEALKKFFTTAFYSGLVALSMAFVSGCYLLLFVDDNTDDKTRISVPLSNEELEVYVTSLPFLLITCKISYDR